MAGCISSPPTSASRRSFPLDLAALGTARLQLHAGRRAADAAAVRRRDVPAPVRLTSYVDAPAGSGLGSSSALVVALVEAFAALLAAPLGPYDVAHLAFEMERIELGLAGGKQDQYAATFGGMNFIEFHAARPGDRQSAAGGAGVLNELETSMVICFTGVSRRSEAIIVEQQRGMAAPAGTALDSLHQLKSDAVEMKEALLRGQIARMAEMLNRSWLAKQRTAPGSAPGGSRRCTSWRSPMARRAGRCRAPAAAGS